MNTKSILGILLVILALSLTLGAVSAEGNVTDDASADTMSVEETTVEQVATDSGNVSAAGGDVEASLSANTPVSDVGVKVTPLYDFDTLNTWSIFVYNLGPDDAANTQVFLGSSDNLIYFDHMAFDGQDKRRRFLCTRYRLRNVRNLHSTSLRILICRYDLRVFPR